MEESKTCVLRTGIGTLVWIKKKMIAQYVVFQGLILEFLMIHKFIIHMIEYDLLTPYDLLYNMTLANDTSR